MLSSYRSLMLYVNEWGILLPSRESVGGLMLCFVYSAVKLNKIWVLTVHSPEFIDNCCLICLHRNVRLYGLALFLLMWSQKVHVCRLNILQTNSAEPSALLNKRHTIKREPCTSKTYCRKQYFSAFIIRIMRCNLDSRGLNIIWSILPLVFI